MKKVSPIKQCSMYLDRAFKVVRKVNMKMVQRLDKKVPKNIFCDSKYQIQRWCCFTFFVLQKEK